MIYVGLGVHKVNTTVAWLDSETGEISGSYQCPTNQLAEKGRNYGVTRRMLAVAINP